MAGPTKPDYDYQGHSAVSALLGGLWLILDRDCGHKAITMALLLMTLLKTADGAASTPVLWVAVKDLTSSYHS